MKTLVNRLYVNPKYAKAFHWGKLITVTGSAQIVVQIIGFVCGILVIRFLSTEEYAFYTLANTMLGTIILLSDGGIAAGVMAQGGKVWTDRNKLGVVLVTGLDLRRKFAIGSLLIAIPILLYLLLSHGASLVLSVLIVLSLIPVFFASLSDTLLEIPLKLKQAIVPLQKNQVLSNVGRLILTGSAVFLFPWSYIALLAGGLPRMYANYLLNKKANEHADLTQTADPVIRKEIISIVRRILPGAVYHSISGQITIWLISIFGTTAAVAQVGAISRLTVILSIFSTLFATLVVPRFARLPDERKRLLTKFLQIQLALAILSILIIAGISIFSSQLLSILGKDYAGLNTEIVMMTIGSCVGMMAGLTHSVSISRGWILPPAINISGNLITQVVLLILLDISKIENVLSFSILNSAVAYGMLFVCFIYRNSRIVKLEI